MQNPDELIEQYQLAKKDRERLERMRHIGCPMTFEEWMQGNGPATFECAFKDGAASRDAEIAELQRKLANKQARDIHSCHPNCTREGCVNRRLRAELAAALAACKVKDEAMLFARNNLPKIGHIPDCLDPYLEKAIAIQPDDSALKTWLGEPVGTTTYGDIDAMRRGLLTNFTVRNTEEMKKAYHSDFLVDLYIKPKELK